MNGIEETRVTISVALFVCGLSTERNDMIRETVEVDYRDRNTRIATRKRMRRWVKGRRDGGECCKYRCSGAVTC